MARRGWKFPAGVVAAALGAAAAFAQPSTYLSPDTYRIDVGGPLAVRVERGQGAAVQRIGWPTERIDWLFVREAGTQTNRENVGPAQRGGDSITVTPRKPGVTLVALDTKPRVASLSRKQFRTFVLRVTSPEQKLESRAAAGDGEIRVRRIESAKGLVRVSDPEGRPVRPSAVAQSKTGQAVEIRPLADPTMTAVGSDLPLRAYVLGEKLVGARMLATCIADGVTREAITDESGSCHFRIASTGVWRVEFHDVRPLSDDPEATWAIYSATLTFEVTRNGAGR